MKRANHVPRTAGPPPTSLFLPGFLIAAGIIVALGAIAYLRIAYVESD
ncbi:hypothetical protein [Bradyrhizobium sp. USDA 10063]